MNDSASALGDYLRARRELVQPEDVGLARDLHRRVRGLRREEVAAVATISSDYYLRLEQGRDHQPSDQVLLALARALCLDSEATAYLFRLAHPGVSQRRASMTPALDEDLLRLLEQFSGTPALVIDRNHDVAAANDLAGRLCGRYVHEGSSILNLVFSRLLRATAPDWPELARGTVASFRFHSDPRDARRRDLVRSLSRRDPEFRRLWARHDASASYSGRALLLIDGVGPVRLRFQNLAIPGRPDHALVTFFGEAGTPGPAALAHLAAQSTANGTAARLARV
ncbi:MmyB family transcriptional regulator [Subtercola sp. YIM 133946]|uniref:MmyB family transcriptional regulator n=1 Tax=Subtercola sp. YIM 133946 TaxID=3118909 RepID=UPI002F9342E1